MDHPPPHAFSRSPVEEVICRCTLGRDAGSLSMSIPGPYPGWPHIRERIREMIAGAEDISRITGCMLQYTDLIPVHQSMDLPGMKDIEQLLSGKYNCHTVQDEVMLFRTHIPGTAGSIRSHLNRPGKPVWTLVFSIQTEGPARFASCEDLLDWFDDARAGIHALFDIIVPEEIIQALK